MNDSICFRSAHRGDASALWQLVQSTGTLDLNSPYFYLAFAEYFGETCLVATKNDQLVGGVVAFCLPRQPEVLFVWQIGVLPTARRQGLAKKMLFELLLLPSCAEVRFMHATITPDNQASQYLFRSFAKSLAVPCKCSKFFTSDLFPTPHQEEELYVIGALSAHQH